MRGIHQFDLSELNIRTKSLLFDTGFDVDVDDRFDDRTLLPKKCEHCDAPIIEDTVCDDCSEKLKQFKNFILSAGEDDAKQLEVSVLTRYRNRLQVYRVVMNLPANPFLKQANQAKFECSMNDVSQLLIDYLPIDFNRKPENTSYHFADNLTVTVPFGEPDSPILYEVATYRCSLDTVFQSIFEKESPHPSPMRA